MASHRSKSPAPRGASRRSASRSRRARSRGRLPGGESDVTGEERDSGRQRGRREGRDRSTVTRGRSPVPKDASVLTHAFAFLNRSLHLSGAFLGSRDAAMRLETADLLDIIKSRRSSKEDKDRAERLLREAKKHDLHTITVVFLFAFALVAAVVCLFWTFAARTYRSVTPPT